MMKRVTVDTNTDKKKMIVIVISIVVLGIGFFIWDFTDSLDEPYKPNLSKENKQFIYNLKTALKKG